MLTTLRDLWKKAPIGKYSGSPRIDPSELKEPEIDSDYTRKLWLEDVANDEDFGNDFKKKFDRYYELIRQTANPDKLHLHYVGESHIDVAWKWRYEQTRQKGLVTLKKAVFHAEKYPGNFTYANSEPVLLQWILEDAPEVFEQVKKNVESGGIELVGGSWVEPDCMMPCGEAFVRQRLYGQRFYYQHFHKLANVEWFLDSFGYNLGLPQLLVKSGATSFWTSKITWNRITTFPFVNFWWESPDGSKLLTSNFQMGYGSFEKWMMYEVGRHPIKEGGKKRWDYRDNYENICDEIDDNPDNIIPPVGIFFGAGDGGHGPTHQEVAEAQMAVKLGYGKWSRAEAYFNEIREYGDKLPIWNDELYLEYHQGTFSIHFEVKRHNRYFERKLIAVESMANMLSIFNKTYKVPIEKLEALWKIVLLNHFHDVLPGSSIPEVYDDVFALWQECHQGIAEIIADWMKKLPVPLGSQLTFTNTLAWERKTPAFIPLNQVDASIQLDANGKAPYLKLVCVTNENEIVIAQPAAAERGDKDDTRGAGWWTILNLPAFATKCYKFEILKQPPQPEKNQIGIDAKDAEITNGVIYLKLDPKTGAILELNSKDLNDNKNLLKGDQSNLTLGFLDDYPNDHAWNTKPEYWKYPLVIPNDKSVQLKLIDVGPVFATIEVSRSLGDGPIREKLAANEPIGANQVWQKITLFKDLPIAYLTYEAEWKQPWLMLKIAYDTATEANTTTADAMYCPIERSSRPSSPCDKARYEKIMHTYCDVSTPENTWGMAMLNEGKYAYDATAGQMRLTLLRTATYTTAAGEAWVNKERKLRKEKDGTEVPKYIDLGFFRCRYALFPHKGGALKLKDGAPNSVVKKAAEEFNVGIVVQAVKGNPIGNSYLTDGTALITCEPSNVLISTFKQKEWERSTNSIIRVVEVSGTPVQSVQIKFHGSLAGKIKNIKATNLLETEIQSNHKWDAKTGILTCSIGKFEVLTFELQC